MQWIKIAKKNLRSNNILTILLFLFMILYYHDHSELNKLRYKDKGSSMKNINHKERLEKRKVRLKEVCESYNNPSRVEYSSLFHRHIQNNICTGTYFHVQQRDHFICNVLKSGSTSWQMFFAENQINSTHIADCQGGDKCPKKPELKIMQVRHPFERLLSAYRHLFKNGGWKPLDLSWSNDKELEQFYIKLFSKSWPEFVTDIIINNEFRLTESELDDIVHPGTWLKTHWAPFWFTCGVCNSHLAPDYILKLETLPWDLPEVMEVMGLNRTIKFPDIRVTGNDDNFSEGNMVSQEVVGKYFSQLTTLQILNLYEVYKTDFIMFDYSPDSYLELAIDNRENKL